jgi:queuine tRNA-ribosyltransferase
MLAADDRGCAKEARHAETIQMSAFSLLAEDGNARAGVLNTRHGPVETPVFMPVGTQATVKALAVTDLEALGAKIILGNTYHLALRPGEELIAALGGLHRFMAYPGAILTDSGGFQVFSLAARRKVDDDGVTFSSHIDGSEQRFTPERAMAVQAALGSDIAMAFDECPPSDAPKAVVQAAMDRTTRWAQRCLAAPRPEGQLRFGIVQGGIDVQLRRNHLGEMAPLGFEGMALGGLGVGEPPAVMHEVVDAIAPEMPRNRPRYLMGVGRPEDLLAGIAAGIDMFDCVMPTRNARNGQLFTRRGKLNIGNNVHRTADRPLEEGCPCATCRQHSRAYLAHLFRAKELLYHRLATIHNLQHYLDLAREARAAILARRFQSFLSERRTLLAEGAVEAGI